MFDELDNVDKDFYKFIFIAVGIISLLLGLMVNQITYKYKMECYQKKINDIQLEIQLKEVIGDL